MIKLRDYQTKFIADIRETMASGHKKIIAYASTGAGKSIVIAQLAKLVLDKGGKVNIILPRKSLVSQLSETFTYYGINHTVFMSGESYYTQARCRIISIDTYLSRLKSEKIEFLEADLTCIDEAHAQMSDKKIELFNQYKMVIGFTATPQAPKNRPLNLIYSAIVPTLPMNELQRLGNLLPFRYFAFDGFHTEGVKTDRDGEFIGKDIDALVNETLKDEEGKTKIVGDVYTNWKKIASDRSTVVFAKTQAHARALVDEFISHGVSTEYIDCMVEMNDRQEIFDRIKTGKAQVIINVGIISMGIDLVILSCVVLATPIAKLHKYHQAAGRASRPYKDQKDAIIIDHAGIIARLGFVEDEQEWTLDGKHTVEELMKKAKEDAKEPKDIKCAECGSIYRSRRDCPTCGFESIKEGVDIPHHEANLTEVKKPSKPKPADKQRFYAMLLHYANDKGYKRGWADHKFKSKFGHFPAKKRGIEPIQPDPEMQRYINQPIKY